jgi:hypothetical protein
VTVDSCSAIDPVSIITGERRYNFNTYVASQLILFSNCYARYARHACVSNGTSTVSGIVFSNITSENSENSSEGHRLWSQGLLYDNYRDINTYVSAGSYVLGLYNRGNYGSGHGWAAVHSVAWNCNTGTSRIIIQKPPTAQNYAIGCTGGVTGAGPFTGPQGYIEGSNTPGLSPQSLYKAQLAERLSGITAVSGPAQTQPAQFHLDQNYPNPFNPSTIIRYDLSAPARVHLEISDRLGRVVDVLVDRTQPAGQYQLEWNAGRMPSGMYFLRLRAGQSTETRRIVVIK